MLRRPDIVGADQRRARFSVRLLFQLEACVKTNLPRVHVFVPKWQR